MNNEKINQLLKKLNGFLAYLKRSWHRTPTYEKIAKVGLILLLICVSCTVCSCSPQRQLSNLLTRHPELHQDTALAIRAPHILPADSADIDFTFADLGGSCLPDDGLSEQSRTRNNDLTVATRSGATATISATGKQTNAGDDIFNLSVRQAADTIYITDTITVPAYITKTEYKDKIIIQMNKPQRFFFGIGIFATFFVLLILAIRFIAWIKYRKL